MSLGLFITLIIQGIIALVLIIFGIYVMILEGQKTKTSKIGIKLLLGYWGLFILISIGFIWKYGLELVLKDLK